MLPIRPIPPILTPTKHALRQHLRERLRTLDPAFIAAASQQIAAHICSHVRQNVDRVIALFGGLRNEPDLLPHLLPALKSQGACLALFQIDSAELHPRRIESLDDLQRGPMHVWEPKPHCPRLDIAALDLILVPGLAFTRDGARLGRGGGYYDRLLANPACRAQRIAIAFDLQIIDHIPVEPHDQFVHQIITESSVHQC
ncbi:MAG: 5-formyltetrahydrofolate cyclo-ligase [Prosthecobacter sp.]|uniref:5-formyltetrahydrofolate cyclo-ligase n=1 Tax=Prosthecobacter sp. TaxID=1965333 RepID=UPI0038FF6FBA